MQEHHIDITTSDGVMNTFITHSDENGPHPVVLFLMDAPGKREELHDMARRIATVGYYVMLPNLYYRTANEFISDGTDESREIMFEHMNSLTNKLVVEDCRTLLTFSEEDIAAGSGPVGCTGYCMSGPFAFAAAAHIDRVSAALSIHGVRLCIDSEDSPHLDADKIKGEVYFGCAETDDWAPPEQIERLDSHLKAAGTNYRIEWFPGTVHGFVFPERDEKYHKAAAERHWEVLFDMFKRNL
jgi:carboxymethylenebutenolidase